MIRGIIALVLWVVYISVYVLLFVPTILIYLITLPFDNHREITNRIFMFIGRSFLWINPFWKYKFIGLEHVKPGERRIFVANHQSMFDMVFFAALPWQMKWVFKEELYRVPFLGQYLFLAGHVPLARGTTKALTSLKRLHPYLDDNIPVMIYPEGTRSKSGDLLKFKNGAFLLAKETNTPIQPIIVSGTREILPASEWRFNLKGEMTASLLPPFYPENFDSIESFRDTVYKAMKSELDHLRKFSSTD